MISRIVFIKMSNLLHRHIENIADATLYLMDKNDLPPFAVFNYIDKPDLTSVEIAEACYTALGKKIPRLRIPLWMLLFAAIPFDIIIALTGKNLPVSTPRIKKLFVDQTKFEAQKIIDAGFKAEASVRNGIERTATWYMEKGKNQSAQWHQPPAEVFRK